MFLASLGILRMPDLYTRMSATSKAATLGSGLVMLAAAVYFNEFSITVRVLAIIVFSASHCAGGGTHDCPRRLF